MSQRRTRGNPNPRGIVNVQPSPVSIPNEGNPQPAVENPNSTTTSARAPTSSNPTANLPPTPAIVTTPGSSNPTTTPMEVAEREDFGIDKDLNTLLKHL